MVSMEPQANLPKLDLSKITFHLFPFDLSLSRLGLFEERRKTNFPNNSAVNQRFLQGFQREDMFCTKRKVTFVFTFLF